jgi:hypothetical protein
VDRHGIRGSRLDLWDHAVSDPSDPMDQDPPGYLNESDKEAPRFLNRPIRGLLEEKKKHIKQLQKEVERLEEMLASVKEA